MAMGEKQADGRAPELGTEALRREIATVRADLVETMGELFDVRRQVRQNVVPLLLVAAALLGVAVGGIALARARRRRRDQLGPRLSRLQDALQRMVAHPSRVANHPGIGRKVVGAAGAAAATVVARKLAQRLVSGKRGSR